MRATETNKSVVLLLADTAPHASTSALPAPLTAPALAMPLQVPSPAHVMSTGQGPCARSVPPTGEWGASLWSLVSKLMNPPRAQHSHRFGPNCAQLCGFCGTNAECNDGLDGDGSCDCSEGWTGASCTDCVPTRWGAACDKQCEVCGSHGDCRSGTGGDGQCTCDNGWQGQRCDACASGFYG